MSKATVRISFETYRYMISEIRLLSYKTSVLPLSAYGNISSVNYINQAQVECVFDSFEEAKEFEEKVFWMELKR